ncbi:MAG: phosphoribosylformylglycinamidine synthase subunit PurQ [Planctomycetota bacterium]|jgi:phosphoribosylformylglycinamidine synthase|nr:phosphoribosylformylglycinamidine synthase subunit PurQ [Planctomycetota bacterium]MDP6940533.1 phosphoribosylformylglycinamidine synthase subunit PurQ [Planctomycetota bacterium]
MTRPRVLQLFAAGVNCDRELAFAWKEAGASVEQVHIRQLMKEPSKIQSCDVFSIPGGFTYGDDLGAGKILAIEVEKFLGSELLALHDRGGSIFGTCNGFQILVKAGLLPGVEGLRTSLTWNRTHRFECRWTRLRAEAGASRLMPLGTILPAPSAHAEGRLVVANPTEALAKLEEAGCIAFRYADDSGSPTMDYPACPNGSLDAIAGLASPSGRILGLMPHPERNLSALHLPDRGAGEWGNGGEGLEFFRAFLAPYALEKQKSP